jgi:hypothetical protein
LIPGAVAVVFPAIASILAPISDVLGNITQAVVNRFVSPVFPPIDLVFTSINAIFETIRPRALLPRPAPLSVFKPVFNPVGFLCGTRERWCGNAEKCDGHK